MKKYLLSSAAAAAILAAYFASSCLTSSRASAQQPASPGVGMQSRVPIALVDVNYIFKRHVRLKANLKELQEGARVQKGFEDQLRGLQEESKQLGPGGFKPGSPEYVALEEKLVKLKADIQAQIQLKRKEFIQREAHLYYNAYLEISDAVAAFCQQNGIALVMNFNGDSINVENPDDVARGISNKVVYYDKRLNLDITPYIRDQFMKPLPPAGPAAFNPPTTR